MKRRLPLWLLVLLGAMIVLVCGYYLLGDWAALNRAFMHFELTVRQGADLKTLFVAEAYQNTFRLNCFADGVGVLMGAILAAIGIHGLVTIPPAVSSRKPGSGAQPPSRAILKFEITRPGAVLLNARLNRPVQAD